MLQQPHVGSCSPTFHFAFTASMQQCQTSPATPHGCSKGRVGSRHGVLYNLATLLQSPAGPVSCSAACACRGVNKASTKRECVPQLQATAAILLTCIVQRQGRAGLPFTWLQQLQVGLAV